jgi:hypothetical protein
VTRDINADLQAQFRSVDPKPTHLVEIQTDSGWLRYTDSETDVIFPTTGGSTFTARPMQFNDLTTSGSDFPSFEVIFGDTDSVLDAAVVANDFRWKKLRLILVERDSLDSSAKAIKHTFRIAKADPAAPYLIRFTADPLQGIFGKHQIPIQDYTREEFPGLVVEGMAR